MADVAKAAIIGITGVESFAYDMFEACELAPEGAVLRGPLMLEVSEEFILELSLASGEAMRIKARVVSVERGERPGMRVEFPTLSRSQREQLRAAANSE